MALLTDLDIINAACARIGAEPLEDVDDDNFGGQQASLIYDDVVEFNLGLYLFSFSRRICQLSQRTGATPLSGWDHVFDLPAERLGPPLYVTDDITDPDRRFNRFSLVGGQVHASASPLFAEIRFRPAPDAWGPVFRAATITAVASKLCMSLASDRTTRDTLHQEAYGTSRENYRGGQIGAAIRDDARATPPRRPDWQNNPLTRSWRSGSGACRW